MRAVDDIIRKENIMLTFNDDYSNPGSIGMAINSGEPEGKVQRLIDALQSVSRAAGELGLYVNGDPFDQTCRRVLGVIQENAVKKGTEVFVPKRGWHYGIKATSDIPGNPPHWYTDRRHSYDEASRMAAGFNKAHKGDGKRFTVELIDEGEKY